MAKGVRHSYDAAGSTPAVQRPRRQRGQVERLLTQHIGHRRGVQFGYDQFQAGVAAATTGWRR